MRLIFPDSVEENTQQHGVCYVDAWPVFTTDEINVLTDDGCAITKYPISINSTYTMAIFYTLDNVSNSCQRITCWTQFEAQVKYIHISN